MKNVIEINKLTKYYGRSRGIIDVSFNVKEGEVFGFIGPNGAGKSTTIRTLLGFLHPTSGSAKIFDMDCTNESHKIKMNLGYIPSEVNYYDDMKIKDILQYSAKFYKKDCSKRINYLSDVFEVPLNKRIEELSFGNKKKVAIIQALLHEPKLLILDEPTVGLDPLMQNRFFEVLREENKKGVTIFFSSHILSEVQKLCTRVAIIKEGKILKVEEMEKLMSDNFKRIKLEFSKIEMVDHIKIPGMVSISKNERFVEFLYIGKINDLIKQLVQYDIENLSIEDPSLEEIFMHYYEKEVG
ncbi:ABC-2 type transport system ATP-binding protein [Caldanaerobius fijiensis DSM 17918]|uniref:ABC-2 type transport system ATP-binding protein n=1 Tax=Caldanaerobius fijiensis DSM 17918 TaxID=1121256 RepID=A0A1M5E375_9THEO|nr:ABC transporter ATP-binding protein [Caldanaerobius fijiensis]SHF73646.1 ABC-2 type transport system ATP-binding protein [Caldanaerobius fijiensis DSM 17918]